VLKKVKKKLLIQFRDRDPIALLCKMSRLQKKLWKLAVTCNDGELSKTAFDLNEMIARRAKRKTKFKSRTQGTPTAKIFDIVQSLPHGASVQADDFLEFGPRHFVNVTLQRLCERDGILARPAWGKYIRIDPSESSNIQNIRRKLRKPKTEQSQATRPSKKRSEGKRNL
jgi:hypothetical protein